MDNWRVVVLGDDGVGKTALATQFALNCFFQMYDPTIEEPYRKQFEVDNRTCFVQVIDTTATLRDEWVRDGDGFILMYSIGSRATFERLEIFRQYMRRVKRGDPVFMLVGNKCDKTYAREVSREEGAALAHQYGCGFLETSAATAKNVEQTFMNLVRSLRQTRHIEPLAGTPVPSAKKEKKASKCVIM